MTCTYAFWWGHIFVLLTILPGNHIFLPQGPNIYFLNNLTKNIKRKFNVVSDSAWWDLSIEPIKMQGLCKNTLESIIFLTPHTWIQVACTPLPQPWNQCWTGTFYRTTSSISWIPIAQIQRSESCWAGWTAGVLFLVPGGTYFHLEPPHAVYTRLRKDRNLS